MKPLKYFDRMIMDVLLYHGLEKEQKVAPPRCCCCLRLCESVCVCACGRGPQRQAKAQNSNLVTIFLHFSSDDGASCFRLHPLQAGGMRTATS